MFHTRSPEETQRLGERLGEILQAPAVVALVGELGVGKTCFIQGVARGLGVKGYVPSPTFTLIREHHGRVPVYHVDLYRLEKPQELEDLGLEEILEGEGVVLIEWAEKVRFLLPPEHLQVELRFGQGDEEREILIVPHGERYRQLLHGFSQGPHARASL
ncbi:MAG: tRNA (adenosine(37)-N6)-threonylcarbamoyltransferase complex ATPase subunit type 1 TsaE [Armatimonadota bacterium]|nr:tRNA (adenosine(37)-N6)-threonylcarbamoyltransferase complex ATPase subunit type 1 TsaE [Armatimonadota bacterium]